MAASTEGAMATITGGDKLKSLLKMLEERMTNASSVKVGFLAEATYPDGKPVAMIAAIQEFGAPRAGIPPRPFFRNMIAAKSPEWPAAMAALLKANGYDAFRALQLTGEGISGQLKQSIIDTNSPPLAQATIDRKGFAKPLVEKGIMLQAVSYEVKE
jgi:hypothetical protein